jgi:hypothetical protein
MESVHQFLTLRQISEDLGLKFHVVKYAIEQSHIEPCQRAGVIRLYRPDQLPLILEAIEKTKSRREVSRAL